jgi:hypothetical protein
MILKGAQRSGTRQLATHLLNDRDNDHVTVHQLRGFLTQDLFGAMAETQAISKGTRCEQPVFSLSLNPPKDADASIEVLVEAADRAELALGLKDQPRAIVIHEKNGRRHAHVVWSRIDADEMKAINLPHFKNKLRELSKNLYLEHGWELPDGHKTNGWKNPLNFTLAEWQQAKRLDLDPREIKQVFQSAWAVSDNLPSFRNALEERGYFLAKGDRRGFVVLDIHGEPYSLSRWIGLKTKEVSAKLGTSDGLPSVQETKAATHQRLNANLRAKLDQDRDAKLKEMAPLLEAVRKMAQAQREERDRLDTALEKRRLEEVKERAGRFKRGLGAVLDFLTGKTQAIRRVNETEAYARYLRDRALRELLFKEQSKDRQALQKQIDSVKTRQRRERMGMARNVLRVLRLTSGHRPERGIEQPKANAPQIQRATPAFRNRI